MSADFTYDIKTKTDCWYYNICDKSKCGEDFCIRHYKMSALVNMACMEGNLSHSITLRPDKVDFDAYIRLRDIKEDIVNFVSAGKSLLIYSTNTGNGKTEWAKKLILSWFDNIWSTTEFECRGLFVSIPKLMLSMKSNISKTNDYYQYINENIEKADLCIFDELNYKELSQFEHDYLLNIINQRIYNNCANIYTSNFDLNEISNRLGTRLASRIVGGSELVEFKGTDKRGLNVNG